MKGFSTQFGYVGYVYGRWMLFATEEEYNEYVKENYQYEE